MFFPQEISGFLNGVVAPLPSLCLSPMDRGFLFGDGVYEAIRLLNGHPLLMEAHIDRLRRSLAEMRINADPLPDFFALNQQLVEKNGLLEREGLLYIQVSRGADFPRRHAFPPPHIPPTLFVVASPFTPNQAGQTHGIHAITLPDRRWGRCDIKSISMAANVLAHQAAKEVGAEEVLFLRDGFYLEGSHTNLFAVIQGRLVTPPLDHRILAGITRRWLIEWANQAGLDVEERPLTEQAVREEAEELFIAGTTSDVTPIIRLDNTQVGDGVPGAMTQRCQEALKGFMYRDK